MRSGAGISRTCSSLRNDAARSCAARASNSAAGFLAPALTPPTLELGVTLRAQPRREVCVSIPRMEASVRSRSQGHGSSPGSFAVLCAGVAFSAVSAIIAAKFARLVLTPAKKPEDKVEVVSLEPSDASPAGVRVWLRGPDIALEGKYSFIFDADSRRTQFEAGHARLGPVVAQQRRGRELRVARDVEHVDQGQLRVGARGRITGWWFIDPQQLGYRVQRVALPMPHGVAWGWVIHPKRRRAGRWAIHVHGRGALPQETLRGVIPFAQQGVTSLVLNYRNDLGAPPGLGGRYGLGLAESEDVEAAIGWASTQGASAVTLVGWSMGATACVLASAGRFAPIVNGIVLDSPALDWPEILHQQARLAHLPRFIGSLAMLMLSLGVVRGAVTGNRRTDLSALRVKNLAAKLRVPTLIHASPGDTFVPWGGALRAAQLRPSLVRLRPAKGEHVKLWNVDPEGWQAETEQFIRGL